MTEAPLSRTGFVYFAALFTDVMLVEIGAIYFMVEIFVAVFWSGLFGLVWSGVVWSGQPWSGFLAKTRELSIRSG